LGKEVHRIGIVTVIITPHDYQQDYLNAIEKGWADGHRHQLVVSPTGSGKGNMMSWEI